MTRPSRKEGLTSVRLRPQILRLLAHFGKRGMSKSEVINEALRQYLIGEELRELRTRLLPYAQAKGVYTHEDLERFLK